MSLLPHAKPGVVRRSSLFLPTLRHFNQKEKTVRSHKLLVKAGYIRQTNLGIYNYLPFGLRVLDKIEGLVDVAMKSVGGQKVAMPLLLSANNWKKTGRWETTGEELFRLKDRHDVDHCLSPTHEEVVTELVAQNVFSHRDLPLSLYQIGKKYRDERRPRFGPMRAREFIMKDMYSFDKSIDDARETYELVRDAYHNIFKALELNYVEVEADSGNIGGNLSHEFHVLSSVGEDAILSCDNCTYSANVEKATPFLREESPDLSVRTYLLEGVCHERTIEYATITMPSYSDRTFLNETKILASWNIALEGTGKIIHSYKVLDVDAIKGKSVRLQFIDSSLESSTDHTKQYGLKSVPIRADFLMAQHGDACEACDGQGVLVEKRGIEIGHIFFLGQKYSSVLNATYTESSGKSSAIEMGCYGIGISRILAAAIENGLAVNEVNTDEKSGDNKIIWPSIIAPYQCVLLTATKDDALIDYAQKLASMLVQENRQLEDELILDDRWDLNFGPKMKEATLWGAPMKIILGKNYLENEIIEIETSQGESICLDEAGLFNFVADRMFSIEQKYYQT